MASAGRGRATHRRRRPRTTLRSAHRPAPAPTASPSTATSALLVVPSGAKSLPSATRAPSTRRQRRGEPRRCRKRGARCPSSGAAVNAHALALALDHETHRRRLHPAGRQPRSHLAPAHLRHRVAEEPVDDAAALLGIDQPVVDVAAVVDGVLDGRRGDLVEHHALDGHLRLEHLEEVPGDGLALAVLVGGEVELVGFLQRRPQLADDLLLVGVDLVVELEAVVDVDRQALAWGGRGCGPSTP